MRWLLALLFAVPLMLGAPGLVDAAGKNKNKGKAGPVPTVSKGKNQGQSGDVATDKLLGTVISAVERALIGDYVRKAKTSGQGLPPGLAKRQHLPPGLQKHIERTGRLPPGLEKRRLPGDLRALLPIRRGQDFRVVGNDIVLIEIATELILDVMQGVLR